MLPQCKTHCGIFSTFFYNKIFISSNSIGLDMLDIKIGNTKTLVKKNVLDTYILDNKWVYYVGTNGDLNRVTKTGEISETVFK